MTIDTGVFSDSTAVDHKASDVAAAAGHELANIRSIGRSSAVAVMAEGAAHIVASLVEDCHVAAVVAMGGSNAGVVFSHVAPEVPFGVPKILMATIVAGETRPYVAGSDVLMLYPVVDIEGDNYILRDMVDRLARVTVASKQEASAATSSGTVPSVGISMYGVTNDCVTKCRKRLSARGIESLVFHANGTGGRSLESFATQGMIDAVLDITISELADELFGGLWSAGVDRLRVAARVGVPQVIAPGAIDMINFGRLESLPAHYRGRTIHQYNELVTLVRTTPDENRELGVVVADRLGEPQALTVVLVPMRGVSALDDAGGPFHNPAAVEAFAEGLEGSASNAVRVERIDAHINSPAFADALVGALPAVEHR